MYAVIYEVEFKKDWEGDADAELDMVVAATKETPGFVSGTWIGDGTTGMAIVIVDSEETARAETEGAAMPPEASVTLRSAKYYEVARTA